MELVQSELEKKVLEPHQLPTEWLEDINLLDQSGMRTALMISVELGCAGVRCAFFDGGLHSRDAIGSYACSLEALACV